MTSEAEPGPQGASCADQSATTEDTEELTEDTDRVPTKKDSDHSLSRVFFVTTVVEPRLRT